MSTPPNPPQGFLPPNQPSQDHPPTQPSSGYQQPGFQQANPGGHHDAKAQLKAAKAYAKATRPWYKKKRFWALLLLALLVLSAIFGGGDDSGSGKDATTSVAAQAEQKEPAAKEEAAPPAEKPLVVTADKMEKDLEANALKATNTYKDKLVTVTGTVGNIDASGQYFSINGDREFELTNIQIFINEEQKAIVSEFSEKQKVTVTGRVTDVGEVLGYSIDADSIK